jgi:hypothetical protein
MPLTVSAMKLPAVNQCVTRTRAEWRTRTILRVLAVEFAAQVASRSQIAAP